MSDQNPSIMSHVSVGTNDLSRSLEFYDVVMPTIGASRVHEIELDEIGLVAVAYGKQFPEFWVNLPSDQQPADTANGVHFAFLAGSRQEVHDFWDAAVGAGAEPDGEPGPRPHYGEPYYGCFVRDPDGHKIEAMFWDSELAAQTGHSG